MLLKLMPCFDVTFNRRHRIFTAADNFNLLVMSMVNIIERLKEGLFAQSPNFYQPLPSIKIVRAKKVMLKWLETALESKKVIGLRSPALGEGMFLVAVNDIRTCETDEILISLKPYDMSGTPLRETDLRLSSISSVCPFDSFYIDPFLVSGK
jgi:hypothetical protein